MKEEKLELGVILMYLESHSITSIVINYHQFANKIQIEDRLELNKINCKISNDRKLNKINRWNKIKSLLIKKAEIIVKEKIKLDYYNNDSNKGVLLINIPSGRYSISNTKTVINYEKSNHDGKMINING